MLFETFNQVTFGLEPMYKIGKQIFDIVEKYLCFSHNILKNLMHLLKNDIYFLL